MTSKYYKSINMDETTLYVVSLLNEYEDAIEIGKKPDFDPYNEKIFMTIGDDVIEIPDNIKKKAIIKYNIIKDENHDFNFNDVDINNNPTDEILSLVLCISIIITLLYGVGSLRKFIIKL